MSNGGNDGITLPKITKCADIKRKKTRHIAYRHRRVVNVVTLSRPCPLHLRSVWDPDPNPHVFGPPWSGNKCEKTIFLASLKSLKKGVGSGAGSGGGAGSRSGSISQRWGSEDPDPHQYVTDPQHCISGFELLDMDPHFECGSRSGSRRAKMTHKYSKKSKEFSCFEVLDVLFWGLRASPVACASFMCLLHLLVMCHTYFDDSILSSQL